MGLVALAFMLCVPAGPASSQVVLDGSLGPGGSVPFSAGDHRIDATLGSTVGNNLFHSFESFSFPSGESATFSGPASIQAVISRVTGGDLSHIDGVLRSTITGADVYLFNPQGVVFGPNSVVDISGSLHLSTADYLELGALGRFDASAPERTILSAAAPSAFGFLSGSPGAIRIDGATLRLDSGETASLIGGAIDLDGGRFVAPDGRFNVVSLGSGGVVRLEGNGVTTETVSRFGDVSLAMPSGDVTANLATCDGPGSCSGGGRIFVRGGRLIVNNGGLDADSIGPQDAGTVDVQMTGEARLTGQASISTRAFRDGDAGDVILEAGRIVLTDEARITNENRGPGEGGQIRLEAEEIRITREATVIADTLRGSGNAGDVLIDGASVHLAGSAVVSANTADANGGDAGQVRIAADRLVMRGDATVDTTTNEGSLGRGGRVDIDVGVLDMSDAAWIFSSTFSSRAGGEVRIVADALNLSGGSAIATTSFSDAPGGAVSIKSGRIRMSGGAVISSGAEGSGTGGPLIVETGDLVLAGGASISSQSEGDNVFVREVSGGPFSGGGDAGDISITARSVLIAGGSEISSSSQGTGDAGNIRVLADDAIRLDNSAISTRAEQAFGGNIELEASSLLYLVDSEITTSVGEGVGSGGNISIDPDFVVLNRSRIVARADAGSGGNIRIVAGNFVASDDSVVDASANSGIDGTVEVLAPDSEATPDSQALATQYVDASSLLKGRCAARASAAREGSLVVASLRGSAPSATGLLPAYSTVALTSLHEIVRGEDPLLARASRALVNGEYQRSTRGFAHASAVFGRDGGSRDRVRALNGLADAQHALGEFTASARTLRRALKSLDANDATAGASVRGALGNALLALGRTDEARAQLQHGAQEAERSGHESLASSIHNNLGNLDAVSGQTEQAIMSYRRSAELADRAGNWGLQARGLSNMVRVSLDAGELEAARGGLKRVKSVTAELEATPEKARLLIHHADSHARLARAATSGDASSLLEAHAALTEARRIAESTANAAMLSEVLGSFAVLYQIENRLDESLYLARQAARTAREAGAPELEYRWQHLQGVLLWSRGQRTAALRAYRRAVAIIEATRDEALIRYGEPGRHFRQFVAPVYRDLVTALIEGSGLVEDSQDSESLLLEAIAAMERFKSAELRDYFRDECFADLEDKAVPVDRVSDKAAVVYPILLRDRIELLVLTSSGLSRYRVPVPESKVRRAVQLLRDQLRSPNLSFEAAAKALYQWLVAPYEPDIARTGVDTLVFVPDGPLRDVALAALYDGEEFLIERYAIAVTPTLTLTDPRPLTGVQQRVLLAGVTQKVGDFPALKYVKEELEAIQESFGGEIMLDAGFTEEKFAERIRDSEISVLHVASHAQFTGNPENSFLLASNGPILMDELQRYIGATKFRERPLELLVLSACETAVGDDRAALGLSGVAIKAGARSALGSLWSVNDRATATLITRFYSRLSDNRFSKAQALSLAQREMSRSERFAHPYYWAPFLIINNWL